ncbi:MAG: methyltransferase domain-containing protein [Desulfovibrio sp.]|jgi:SAM-dependent methyltransferase|nr:methyltransferase domain-containing protein [Desulfovibrio sp.]
MKMTEFLSFYNFMKSNNFNRLFNQYNNDISSVQYEVPVNISAAYVKKGDSVLDWSCGNGHFSFFLGYKQAQVTGSSFYNAIPESLSSEQFFSLRLVDEKETVALPFDDTSFDSVFSIGTLEHVHETGGDQVLSLKEIRRVLRSHGHFLCFHLPYKYSWVENVGRIIPARIRKKMPVGHPHSKRFNKKDVRSLLEQSGFSLIDFGVYNFLPRNFTYALPQFLKNNRQFIALFNASDTLLSFILPFFCSQSYFVARKTT